MNGLEFLPLVVIILLFWLFFIRPASRRAKETSQMQAGLDVGDKVILTSGFYATVTALHDDRLEVELAPGFAVTVDRRAVGAVQRTEVDDHQSYNETDEEPSQAPDVEEN